MHLCLGMQSRRELLLRPSLSTALVALFIPRWILRPMRGVCGSYFRVTTLGLQARGCLDQVSGAFHTPRVMIQASLKMPVWARFPTLQRQ